MLNFKNGAKYLSLMLLGALATGCYAAETKDVKDKGTATNVAFNQSFVPTEYKTQGKPNVLIISMDDLGYGQLNFDEKAFDKKVLAEKVIPDRYKVDVDKAIEAAKKSTPNLRKLQDQGGYVNSRFRMSWS